MYIRQTKTKRHIIIEEDLKIALRLRRIFHSVPACKRGGI